MEQSDEKVKQTNSSSDPRFKEKRKWQLAFRRYVLEKALSEKYAPYFGLDHQNIRYWFELQFTEGLKWENFGSAWQFDHIIPVAYFNFEVEEDLYLCWNYINIRVEAILPDKSKSERIDTLVAKAYFENLYNQTGFSICKRMLDKINQLEANSIQQNNQGVQAFLINQREWLEQVATLTKEEFARFNEGTSIENLMKERALLKKFG